MNKRNLRTFKEAQIEHYKKHPKELKGYLDVALEEYQKDGDEKAFLAALAVVTEVHGGYRKLAKESGLNRENLYRALSKRTDPRFSTVMQVLSTLGFSLRVA
jgi:probable addiction module antidote protein